MEEIKDNNGNLLAIIFKEEYRDGVNFITKSDSYLQVGLMQHKKGHIVKPHKHRNVDLKVRRIQEVLFIREGKLQAVFYDKNKSKLCEKILTPGDIVILIDGGHGFEVIEDCKIVEVKQGPYISKEHDKEIIGESL